MSCFDKQHGISWENGNSRYKGWDQEKNMGHELRRNIESIARRSLKWTHLGNMKPGRARAHEGGP